MDEFLNEFSEQEVKDLIAKVIEDFPKPPKPVEAGKFYMEIYHDYLVTLFNKGRSI
jgi:hypothetical protein